MERKNIKRKYTSKDLIRDIKGLLGADVRIFGQNVKLNKACPQFYIDTIDVIKELESYEINPCVLLRENGIKVEKDFLNADIRDINTELVQILVENDILTEEASDNSYNWSSPLYNDISMHTYKDRNNNYYDLVCVHRYGDVRGNYTDAVLYKFEYDTQFLETLAECSKTEYVEYCGIEYAIDINPLSKGAEVISRNGEYLFKVYGGSTEDVINEIKQNLKERNEQLDINKEIYLYDVSNTETQNKIFDFVGKRYIITEINKEKEILTIKKIGMEEVVFEILFTDCFELA